MKLFLPVAGIDPGQTGAIALIDVNGEVSVHKMPRTELQLAALLREVRENVELVTIEEQHAFPRQGVVSTFNHGYHYGWLVGAASVLGGGLKLMSAQEWKKRVGILGAIDQKAASRQRATTLFPSLKDVLKKPSSHGISDAVLIAVAGAEAAGLLQW